LDVVVGIFHQTGHFPYDSVQPRVRLFQGRNYFWLQSLTSQKSAAAGQSFGFADLVISFTGSSPFNDTLIALFVGIPGHRIRSCSCSAKSLNWRLFRFREPTLSEAGCTRLLGDVKQLAVVDVCECHVLSFRR